VVRVLEALRERADEGLRFAEVARAADVSQATCHAILATLTDAGYVHRAPETKTYWLGPALVGLAAGAARSSRSARLQPVLDELARRTGLACSAAEAIGDSITVVAVAPAPGRETQLQVGARVPFAPPFGAIHVAWSDPEVVDAWIGRATSPALHADALRAVVRDHHDHGVAVAPSTPASAPFREALAELAANPSAAALRDRTLELLGSIDRLDYTADVVAERGALAVNTITAPVFDARGHVTFAIAVHLDVPELDASLRGALIADLREATDALTRLTADDGSTTQIIRESGAA
jgi:DNA-binding IclR family transcriptional regulator